LAHFLLVGATGFIGSQLAEHLVAKDHRLTISYRPSSNLDKLSHINFEKIILNFEDIEDMVETLNHVSPDYIIYNSGITKAKTQTEFDLVNIEYAVNLAKAILKIDQSVKKFIYMSSIAAHGPAEFQNENILRTSQPTHPVTMYGKSKQEAERRLAKISGLPYLFLRPTIVYGPNEKDLYTVFKLVNRGLGMYSGRGDQKYSFIYISDLVKIIEAASVKNGKSKCYFVTDGNYYSPKELNTCISQELGKEILQFGLSLHLLKIVAYISELFGKLSSAVPALNLDKLNEIKAQNWNCDIQPLIDEIGVVPEIDLREGIKRTVKWYKENSWL
jgi:nucleoside-diphosphate-sugar epimerase